MFGPPSLKHLFSASERFPGTYLWIQSHMFGLRLQTFVDDVHLFCSYSVFYQHSDEVSSLHFHLLLHMIFWTESWSRKPDREDLKFHLYFNLCQKTNKKTKNKAGLDRKGKSHLNV